MVGLDFLGISLCQISVFLPGLPSRIDIPKLLPPQKKVMVEIHEPSHAQLDGPKIGTFYVWFLGQKFFPADWVKHFGLVVLTDSRMDWLILWEEKLGESKISIGRISGSFD